METLRDVFLSIGKGSYNIKTPLNSEDLERVQELIRQAGPHPGEPEHTPFRGMNQENLLVLTCLQLAYTLDAVTTKLQALSERLGTVPDKSEESKETEGTEETKGPETESSAINKQEG
ncbi:MAG: hypothetical protein K6E38_06310 [Fretibacterium sp.]|nr:hypothetical protein [Fretibacterium sp.]